jgi:hypothetical protein
VAARDRFVRFFEYLIRWKRDSEEQMEIIEHKARDVKSGETVLDRSTPFTIKEVRVSAEDGGIMFIDMDQMANNMKSALKLAWEQKRQSAAVNRGQLSGL